MAAVYLCLRPRPVRAALVRHRDVPSVCLRARSGTFSGPARVHCTVWFFAGHTGSATDDLETLGTVRNRRLARVALWNIHRVRHDLPACRIVAADNGEVDCADSCRRLHVSTPGLSRLERPDGAVDEHWRRIPFCRTEWCRPGARLVECSESTVRFTAQVSCPPETTSAHRRQPFRIGRRLHVNRSYPRQDFQIWNRKPHRERAAAVGSRARTVAEKSE